MKIFNYYCKTCDKTEESFVKTSDQLVPCKTCGGPTEKRLTMPAFILKGVGVVNAGTFPKSREGPKIDQELLNLPEDQFNYEMGAPADIYK